MMLPFFYYLSPVTEDDFLLDEATSKHVSQVLRMAEGEALHLTDGKGSLYTAVIVHAHKRFTKVRITEKNFYQWQGRKVSIGISLLKNKARFEWFLEKATELGVQRIYAMRCERTEKEQVRSERLQQILISAMLQSRQCWLPELHTPVSFTEANTLLNTSQKLIAHCVKEHEKHALSSLTLKDEVSILIGPEGDFTPSEIDQSLEAGFEAVSLGEHRLRTETAGVVAATLLCLR